MKNNHRKQALASLSKNRILPSIKAFFSYFSRKGFSSFSLLFLSATTILPNLEGINTKGPIENQEVSIVTPRALEEAELCLWQKDFSFFTELVGETGPEQETVPCEERLTPTPDTPIVRAVERAPAQKNESLTLVIREMVSGYPLEVMVPAIAEYDREVAGLIVGIAKKESNWGKRVPRSPDGADCFNYWGFKGAGSRGVAIGHGCFGSPEEAVQAIGNRITELVSLRKTSEPKNMIIWKCGSSCATHTPESVAKWISDVDLYYKKIVKK